MAVAQALPPAHALLPPPLAGYQWDYVFDWTILKHQQSASSSRPLPRPEGAAAGGPGEDAPEDGAGGTTDSQRRR